VRFIVQRDPGIASLPRRAAATAIDGALLVSAFATAAAAGFGISALLKRSGRTPSWWHDDGTSSERPKRWTTPMTVAGGGLGVIARNWRSPGARVAGVRRVDARTHGPVQLHSAIVEAAVNALTAYLGRAARRPAMERYEARRVAVNAEIEQLRDDRPDAGPRELVDASLKLQRDRRVGCGWLAARMVGDVLAVRLPALWSSRRQTLNERLAGTVVIDDR
jgi:RDD family